ncbi:MAG TPA: BCCT family transporter [Candidatus Blautia stercoravium]|nr:BCCT family transporter [Candidatus Blautia stercoravium]
MEESKTNKKSIRWNVFIPCFLVVGGAAILGMVNNEWLTKVTKGIFTWSLGTFGWLYQIVAMVTLVVVALLAFSKTGNIRFGGKEAKAKYSFGSWFAMTLTGGIATGLITYGVNEVLIYFGNIYGELDGYGVKALSDEAAQFALGRSFYNWTFVPYAMYALSGVVIAYMYFNRKKELSVSASLIPLFGESVTKGLWKALIDILSVLAIALGLASSLGAGLALIGTGLSSAYGIAQGPVVWFILTAIITATFTIASVTGIDKGIKWLAGLTSKIFYVLLIVLFLVGPTIYILNMANVGLGYWLDRFWTWGFDPSTVGGEALVTWWTMYDWAIWIAYAPLMGIFFAMIAYGRTVRQFLVINWILPASFGLVWFSVWGGTALKWQTSGKADIISTIQQEGAVAGIWEFLKHVPLGTIIIPVIIVALIAAFSTTADTMSTTIAALCTKGARHDEEPAVWQKIVWGVSIGLIACIMVAFGGGEQGVDGVKYLAACGGFAVLTIFILQVASAIKLFFFDKETKKDIEQSEEA